MVESKMKYSRKNDTTFQKTDVNYIKSEKREKERSKNV